MTTTNDVDFAPQQENHKAKAVLADLWGEVCPDCGPEDYENTAREISERLAAGLALRSRLQQLREALQAICEDAVGEQNDPLFIVRREFINAGYQVLAGLPQEP